jgi:hypothetical protein
MQTQIKHPNRTLYKASQTTDHKKTKGPETTSTLNTTTVTNAQTYWLYHGYKYKWLEADECLYPFNSNLLSMSSLPKYHIPSTLPTKNLQAFLISPIGLYPVLILLYSLYKRLKLLWLLSVVYYQYCYHLLLYLNNYHKSCQPR